MLIKLDKVERNFKKKLLIATKKFKGNTNGYEGKGGGGYFRVNRSISHMKTTVLPIPPSVCVGSARMHSLSGVHFRSIWQPVIHNISRVKTCFVFNLDKVFSLSVVAQVPKSCIPRRCHRQAQCMEKDIDRNTANMLEHTGVSQQDIRTHSKR